MISVLLLLIIKNYNLFYRRKTSHVDFETIATLRHDQNVDFCILILYSCIHEYLLFLKLRNKMQRTKKDSCA